MPLGRLSSLLFLTSFCYDSFILCPLLIHQSRSIDPSSLLLLLLLLLFERTISLLFHEFTVLSVCCFISSLNTQNTLNLIRTASSIKHQASSIKHQASSIKHQASSIKHQASSIKQHLISFNRIQAIRFLGPAHLFFTRKFTR
jgi:hypothetical protein